MDPSSFGLSTNEYILCTNCGYRISFEEDAWVRLHNESSLDVFFCAMTCLRTFMNDIAGDDEASTM